MDKLIPPPDQPEIDNQTKPEAQNQGPIKIDLERDSSPETALNNVSTIKATSKEGSSSSSSSAACSPTSANPSNERPGTAAMDLKLASDLTDGDLFGDGSQLNINPLVSNVHHLALPTTSFNNTTPSSSSTSPAAAASSASSEDPAALPTPSPLAHLPTPSSNNNNGAVTNLNPVDFEAMFANIQSHLPPS
ncbi:uncharacterized protein PGTG_01108 [Puccinia graminis f. sp. tritici CRL 75-36-700-3]|uniref:Uncharacterized protein n=1 Tax=Puccinia graminis f. sp. tritici (strain CRL 75-36-700-3 / race SCCL) TaxID=418459 RepID=E3JUQ2_PUCGT|nr:uncharacterized protein PGTG_01108 [Puccinia graminis f. sp. tritici CRL 75-36-700-3]EFP75777.2 hypothetical protein PGTG_01108 [Puccinia graminis f. sp. tritici CRL 75-36-700-3]